MLYTFEMKYNIPRVTENFFLFSFLKDVVQSELIKESCQQKEIFRVCILAKDMKMTGKQNSESQSYSKIKPSQVIKYSFAI